MYANRDKSANYGSLLQIEMLMSDIEMGRVEDLSVFSIPDGRSLGKKRALCANIKL